MRSRHVTVLLVSVAVAALCLAAPATADSGGWTPTPTPNPTTPTGYLTAISCGAVGHCMAVGYATDGQGDDAPLAEVEAGSGWALVPPLVPSGAGLAVLNAVSCTGAASCVAVGFYDDAATFVHAFAERYAAGVWTMQAVPEPAGARDTGLLAVDCTAVTACVAVSTYNDSQGVPRVLGEVFGGTGWALQYVPSPGDALAAQLDGVSCTAAGCTAVGSVRAADGSNQPIAELRDATGWHEQLLTVPGANVSANLQGVSCDASGACLAVGYWSDDTGSQHTLAERRADPGATWTLTPEPPVGGAQNPQLAAIACTGAASCIATGSASVGLVIEQWDGNHWTRRPSGAVPRSGGTGIACPAIMSCVVAGETVSSSKIPVPLLDTYDGVGWHVVPDVPAPRGAVTATLDAVSCSSSARCTAVGDQTSVNGRTTSALAERYDGTGWTTQALPGGSTLTGISCPDDGHCIAGGYSFAHGASHAVVASWDGSTWTVLTAPSVTGATSSDLRAISCASVSACLAVGEYSDANGNTVALAEGWSGGHWHATAVPLPAGAAFAQLTGVSCVGTRCTVVGAGSTARGKQLVIIEVWDGTAWTLQHAALPSGAFGAQLRAVSCPAASTCTAVGSYVGDRGIEYSLVEKRAGLTWTIQPSADPPGVVASPLTGVSCTSVSTCAAAGYDYALGPSGLPDPPKPYAQTSDGAAWHLQAVDVPPGTNSAVLSGLSCTATRCVGVGYRFGSSGRQVTFAVVG